MALLLPASGERVGVRASELRPGGSDTPTLACARAVCTRRAGSLWLLECCVQDFTEPETDAADVAPAPPPEPETMVHPFGPTRWGADRNCNVVRPTRWGKDSFQPNGSPTGWGATQISAGFGSGPDCPRVGGANHNCSQ